MSYGIYYMMFMIIHGVKIKTTVFSFRTM